MTSNTPEGAEGGTADAPRRGAPPPASALPCQNSNNSNTKPKRYRLKLLAGATDWFTSKDNKNAVWEQVDGDTLKRWGAPSGAEAKSAFHLRQNVASFGLLYPTSYEFLLVNQSLFIFTTD